MKTFIRVDVFKTEAEAILQRDTQNAIAGQHATMEQFGAAVWSSRLTGSGQDEVAANTPFEAGVFVVVTEGA